VTLVYPAVHEPVGMVLTAEEYDALPPNTLRELQPETTIHTFRLGDTGYIETGVWTASDTVNSPGLHWATLKVAELDS
jgi:hypothetical protein